VTTLEAVALAPAELEMAMLTLGVPGVEYVCVPSTLKVPPEPLTIPTPFVPSPQFTVAVKSSGGLFK
jgi:hypothetical protein